MPSRIAYKTHLKRADAIISHLIAEFDKQKDDSIGPLYVGFLSTVAFAAYELSLKDILVYFASSHHKLFGSYIAILTDRLNGRIQIEDLTKDHLKKFGRNVHFNDTFKNKRDKIMVAKKINIKTSYENIITWRHEFAHGLTLPATATVPEAKKAYEYGKHVIHCFSECLTVTRPRRRKTSPPK